MIDTIKEQFDYLPINEIEETKQYSCGALSCSTGLTLLMKYVLQNNLQAVTEYINFYTYPNKFVSKKEAARNLSSIIDKTNSNNYTALCLAVANNVNHDIIQLLINNGSNINHVISNGFTPLMYAAANQNVDIIRLLLKYKPELDTCNDKGYTALLIALTRKNFDIIKLLIDAGANVNVRLTDNRMLDIIGTYNKSTQIDKTSYDIIKYILMTGKYTCLSSEFCSLALKINDLQFFDLLEIYMDNDNDTRNFNTKYIIQFLMNNDVIFKGKIFELVCDYRKKRQIVDTF